MVLKGTIPFSTRRELSIRTYSRIGYAVSWPMLLEKTTSGLDVVHSLLATRMISMCNPEAISSLLTVY